MNGVSRSGSESQLPNVIIQTSIATPRLGRTDGSAKYIRQLFEHQRDAAHAFRANSTQSDNETLLEKG